MGKEFARTSRPKLEWLVGRWIAGVENEGHTWIFVLDDGSKIATESVWRVIATKGIVVTSEDHGHQFGLPTPVDAVERVKGAAGDHRVVRFEVREGTGDLTIRFGNEVAIEFLNLSCGYEGWRTEHGGEEVVCLGGDGFGE